MYRCESQSIRAYEKWIRFPLSLYAYTPQSSSCIWIVDFQHFHRHYVLDSRIFLHSQCYWNIYAISVNVIMKYISYQMLQINTWNKYTYDYYPHTAVIEQQRNRFSWSVFQNHLFYKMRNLRFIFPSYATS